MANSTSIADTIAKALKKMQEEIDRISKDKEEAVRSQKFEKAASLRDEEKDLREYNFYCYE